MAESVVTFLLKKLSSLLEDEVKLMRGFRNDVAFVKNELDRIRAFLHSADAAEDEDEEIKVWVKQVREVAYDAEDIIDDFLYRFEHSKRHAGFYAYLSKITQRIKNLKARRSIASQLKKIKLRVTDISEGRKRYGFKELGLGPSSGTKPCYLSELRNDARLLEDAQLVGIESQKQHLLSFLMENTSQLQVAAVVGMGGLGKTTLVNTVYGDLKVKTHFHQIQAWVTVSQSLKLDEVLKQIIQQLYEAINQPLPNEVDKSTDTHFLKSNIVHFLCNKKYLIVLDDIWDVDAWEALKVIFRNNNNGSRIIITTRIAPLVASSSTKDLGGESLTLNPLSSKDSWALFCAKAFQGSPCPSHLEEISRNVLKRCEGLPLAIVAIGSMLATKDMNRVDEFEIVERSLQAELHGNKKLKGMQAILSLSLNDLPYHLKHCLMYLSLFPEDYLIKHNVLIRLWISEGFIEEIEGRSLEEVGHGCFNELINRSLVQVTERYLDGRVNSCRVHDILRETMLLKSKDQSFATITNKESSRRLPKSVRRLCVHEGTKIDTLGENQLSQLRSLLVFTKEINVSFSQKGSRLVKVLDCTSVPMTTFAKDITKLYHLRYLCLRDTNISSIPPSIANLRHLETLDLKNTFVQELPKEILSLECLRHVIVYDYKNSPVMRRFKALKGIDSLSSLRKLNCVEAKLGDTEFLVSIGKLTQLTMLGILKLGAEHVDALFSSIHELKFLSSLRLDSRTEDEVLNLKFKSFSSLRLLQRLYITGRVEKSLEGLQNLTNLSRLRLTGCRLLVDPLESLKNLPNLVLLAFLKGAYDGESLCFKAGSFLKLEKLYVVEMDNLRRVIVEDKALTHLKVMSLENCKFLNKLPFGIEYLRSLDYLYLVDLCVELTETIYSGSNMRTT
ncbi:hypothetical protein F8388_022656 [Cannabis sativa]|uniref:Uncharacterized protein n=1 Tax=Cannabis sativa TaxID=3483 RepID=A0A7J6G4D5_CANSA|nr:hypothetical protein F8388_022656 [Cannabis sativa]